MNARQIELPVAAQRLGKSCAATWGLVVSGKLRAEKKGARWYVVAQDVDRVKAEGEREAPSAPAGSHAGR